MPCRSQPRITPQLPRPSVWALLERAVDRRAVVSERAQAADTLCQSFAPLINAFAVAKLDHIWCYGKTAWKG